MSTTFFNQQRTLCLRLTSEMHVMIESFWVLERLEPHWYGDIWERVCRVDNDDVKKCIRKHNLKPDWEVVEP